MNKFRKYCPNVWIAECEEEYEKGEIIELETKYGKEVECEVYNFLGTPGENFLYSIVRCEDMSYAERKAERYNNSVARNHAKSHERYEASQEGREFLSLGEPIKVGHHSEHRHRALIERNAKRMDKSMEYLNKAEQAQTKADYWEAKAQEITLAMPESLDYFKQELEKAEETHKFYKDNPDKREHAYSLTYAKKDVNEAQKNFDLAKKLWGDNL